MFGIVMRSYLIQIDHGLEWSVPKSYSQGNVFVNPKQERDPLSSVLLWYSLDLMSSVSCNLRFLTRQKITPIVFNGTSPVPVYYTTRHQGIWIGVDGWKELVSSVVPMDLSSSTHGSYSLKSMPETYMIGPHIFLDPTISPHLSPSPATPPMTSPMIMVPTSSWRDIMA